MDLFNKKFNVQNNKILDNLPVKTAFENQLVWIVWKLALWNLSKKIFAIFWNYGSVEIFFFSKKNRNWGKSHKIFWNPDPAIFQKNGELPNISRNMTILKIFFSISGEFLGVNGNF